MYAYAVESAQYDLNKQVNQIENFVASGVQIIVLNAVDSKGIAPAVRRAKEAGVDRYCGRRGSRWRR